MKPGCAAPGYELFAQGGTSKKAWRQLTNLNPAPRDLALNFTALGIERHKMLPEQDAVRPTDRFGWCKPIRPPAELRYTGPSYQAHEFAAAMNREMTLASGAFWLEAGRNCLGRIGVHTRSHEHWVTEAQFRTFLKEHGLSPAQSDEIVRTSIECACDFQQRCSQYH